MSSGEKYIFLFINDAAPKVTKKYTALCGQTGHTCFPPALFLAPGFFVQIDETVSRETKI